ncbi:unnamed protein product [Closterium sp. NIES-54]
MASLRVLAFDHEGRPIQFDTRLDDLQLYLLSDSRDNVSQFDHTSGAAPAPPATADSATRSQWLTHDASARLAIRNHLPLAECAHFGQHKTAQALYDAVVARYSSPTTAALGRLLPPYLFPELSAFATVEDLVSHLRTSDARYRAPLPGEFLDKNPPPIYITLYFIVNHLRDSIRVVLLMALPSLRGAPPPPLPPPTAAVDVLGAEDVRAASVCAKRRSSKGNRGRGGGGGSGGGGEGSSGGGGGTGDGGSSGSGGGSGGLGSGGGGSGGSGGSGSGGSGGSQTIAQHGGSGGGQRQQQHRWSETPSPQQLREWFAQRGASGHRCFFRLDDALRAEFGDEAKLPRWAKLLRSGVAIFDLDYDAILYAMYALSVSAEGDCYLCVPPDPCIEAAVLGASDSFLPGIMPGEGLQTFTLDSGALRCFFCDSTTPHSSLCWCKGLINSGY